VAGGKVVFAGLEPKKYGYLVIIDHGKGWHSAYAKLQKVTVKKGARAKAGERVGLLGNSGETSSTELHFEVRRYALPIDPQLLLPERD
jgi:murein DD-endopeptidase MepM/ murein hydrolase activator NlpD